MVLSRLDAKVVADLEAWLLVSGFSTAKLKSQGPQPQMDAMLGRLALAPEDRRKSQAAFEAFPGHISWVSADLVYLGVNEELARSVGLKPGDFIGKTVGFVNKDSSFSNLIREFMASSLVNDRQVLEIFMPHLNESRWISVIARKYAGGSAAVVLGMDVTELRQVQQLVTDLQRKETLLARLATLGEVAAGMTHEINNPLTVISSGLYALKDRLLELGPMDEDVNQLIEMMSKASGHMVSIVEGARHLSRADAKQPFTNAALWSLVQDAQALCGDKIKSSSTVVRNLVASDLTIYCQPSSLLQIMINLLSNSCDALEELKIDYASRWIEVAATTTESHVQITLTDSGPGIPASVQHTMFQPFFTTKPPGKGTGLGLSIVKSLAAQHQGRIYVDGEHPHTRFVLELPRQKA